MLGWTCAAIRCRLVTAKTELQHWIRKCNRFLRRVFGLHYSNNATLTRASGPPRIRRRQSGFGTSLEIPCGVGATCQIKGPQTGRYEKKNCAIQHTHTHTRQWLHGASCFICTKKQRELSRSVLGPPGSIEAGEVAHEGVPTSLVPTPGGNQFDKSMFWQPKHVFDTPSASGL